MKRALPSRKTRAFSVRQQFLQVSVDQLRAERLGERSVTVTGIQYLRTGLFENILHVHVDDEIIIRDECVRDLGGRRGHRVASE